MKSRFQEGDTVILAEDHPAIELCAGAIGVVWARYATERPAYEVTFMRADGRAIDVTLSEDELAKLQEAWNEHFGGYDG